MVKGLNSFKEWFHGYEMYYTIIGGTACDLLLSDAGFEFRVTKDIDMVLIVEALNADFGSHFWKYVKSAGYEHKLKSSGRPEFYRFMNPKSSEFPAMIELFTRRIEGITLPQDAVLSPLPFDDDISSLSAILLNSEYYDFLRNGVITVDGIPVLDTVHLIPFKVKAWLDLSERKAGGSQVDSKNIRKHKNDVIRLSALLSPDFRINLPEIIASDMRDFLSKIDEVEKYIRVAMAYDLTDVISLPRLTKN